MLTAILRALMWLALLTVAPASARAQGCAAFLDIGTLGGAWADVHAVSDDGRVIVGRSQTSGGSIRAYRWTETSGMEDLGTFGGPDASVTGLSSDGAVVIGRADGVGGVQRAFVWTEGTGLRALAPPPGYSAVYPMAVSSDGAVIVGGLVDPTFGIRAFVWDEWTGYTAIDVPGPHEATATDVSGDGRVVIVVPEYVEEVYRWTLATGLQPICAEPCYASGIARDGATIATSHFDPGWALHAGVWPLPGQVSYAFHQAISQDGSTTVGGMAVNGTASGCCWTEQQAFRWVHPHGPQALGTLGGNEGVAVAVSADGAVVVGHDETSGGTGGSIERGFVWTSEGGLVEIDAPPGRPSRAVDVSDLGDMVAGTYRDSSGASRAFRLRISPIGTAACAPAVTNSTGCSGLLLARGSAEVAANALVLEASRLPSGVTAMLVASRSTSVTPQVGGGQGTLCLGGAIGRFTAPGEIRITGPAGSFAISPDLGVLPLPAAAVAAQPGETWHFQVWYRDVNPGPTSNLTHALSVTME